MEPVRLRDLLSPYPADIPTWEAALADSVHMRIGSARPALGKSAVLPCLAVLFSAIEAIDSKVGQFWKIREALLAETELRWRVSPGTSRVVPCFVVVRARLELIEDLRFYCDLWALPHGRRFRASLGGAARAGSSPVLEPDRSSLSRSGDSGSR